MLLLLTGITAALLLTSTSDSPAPVSPDAQPPKKVDQNAAGPSVSPPVPPASGQPPVQSMPNLTPEESEVEAEDDLTEREQVEAALTQLGSTEVEQRIEGAEQLGAYPTKEAEQALTQVLTGDSSAEVRNAAAQSLGYVEKPTDTTIAALFGALEDQSDEVRGSALSTLEDFMLGSEEGSKRYKKVLAGLKLKLDSRSVPEDTRNAIREILEDLAPAE